MTFDLFALWRSAYELSFLFEYVLWTMRYFVTYL
jgi:hypothetical protein